MKSQFASQTSMNTSPTKFKFKSKASFFNDKESFALLSRNTQQKESLKAYLEQLQSSTTFAQLGEYGSVGGQTTTVAVMHSFNGKFNSSGSDIT